MSLFFGLLPTDLQVDVLHEWINDKNHGYTLVRALSAMDVACPKSHQAAFRSLVRQLPAFGESRPGAESSPSIRGIADYVLWLGRMDVAIQSLLLADNNTCGIDALNSTNLRLAAVESISWTGSQYLSSELIQAVLRACPNLTQLQVGQSVAVNPAHTPRLKRFVKLTGSRLELAAIELQSMLAAFGPQLQELRIPEYDLPDPLFQFICDQCPRLEVVEITVVRAERGKCLRLLQSCKHISELVVHYKSSADVNPGEISDLAACPQLQRLTVKASALNYVAYVLFAQIRSVRPDLQYLKVCGWSYSAPDGILKICLLGAAARNETTLLPGVLDGMRVKELILYGAQLGTEPANLIVQHLQGPLESLRVPAQQTGGRAWNTLMSKFGVSLKHFSSGGASMTDDQLQLIGTHCQLLESITLSDCIKASDQGVSSLLAGCPLLKTVTFSRVPLTNATLHAIVKNKLRLKMLTLIGCGLDSSSVECFRQQVKEHQLLPMPVMRFT